MGEHRNLEDFRSQLDQLDRQLVSLLARRFDICRNVAHFKKEQGIPMMQPARIQIVKQQAAERARMAGLSEEFVVSLYTAIIAEACRLEDDIIDTQDIIETHGLNESHDVTETVAIESRIVENQPAPIDAGQPAMGDVDLAANRGATVDRT